jgi:hypothetical protein
MALARMLMGGPAETQGTAFEPVTRQQQLLNYNTMTGAEDAWRSAEGSPWKAPPPGMLAKLLMHPITQGVMPALDFIGRTPSAKSIARQGGFKGYHGTHNDFDEFDVTRGIAQAAFIAQKPDFAAGFGPKMLNVEVAPGRYFDFRDPVQMGAVERSAKDIWPDWKDPRMAYRNVAEGAYDSIENGQLRRWLEQQGYEGAWMKKPEAQFNKAMDVPDQDFFATWKPGAARIIR